MTPTNIESSTQKVEVEPSRLVTFIFMCLNVFCVVSIVIFNKYLFQDYNFTYPNALMAIHFLFTGFLLWVSASIGLFERKRPPWMEIGKLSTSQVGSVASVNLSLLLNSIGMYQVLKLLNIPVICVMEFFWKNRSQPLPVLLALGIILGGVGITTVTEMSFSFWGFVWGLVATVTTGAYQIMTGDVQKTHGVNAMQTLYYQAPLTTVLLAILAFASDDIFGPEGLLQYKFTTGSVCLIVVTGFIAFGVNLTVFLILGRASPVTYQVVGHFKTCLVIFFGFVALHQPFVWKNFVGICVTMCGIMWYTHLKTQPAKKALPVGDAVSSPPEDTAPTPLLTPEHSSSWIPTRTDSGARERDREASERR
eukprot:TRINITY_DN24323_c0_g1_i1.p1 TRINITY_DN24323_c0_g1~~TRINITY_DN24323_c0_g1_i1.p1  ORF type:complete len:364 (+),score=69.48 TRINITY_DN24323_c0_g1_i1:153-1244(+)